MKEITINITVKENEINITTKPTKTLLGSSESNRLFAYRIGSPVNLAELDRPIEESDFEWVIAEERQITN